MKIGATQTPERSDKINFMTTGKKNVITDVGNQVSQDAVRWNCLKKNAVINLFLVCKIDFWKS